MLNNAPWKVLLDGISRLNLPALGDMRHRRRGEGFRHRGNRVNRAGGGGQRLVDAAQAETARPRNVVAVQCEADARGVELSYLLKKQKLFEEGRNPS